MNPDPTAIQDMFRCEFRRALKKSVEAQKLWKMITWATVSFALVTTFFFFRHYECDDVLFEESRVLRRQHFSTSYPQASSEAVTGTVIDFDVFERDSTFYSFRTVRMNTSKGYPVTCTIPMSSGTNEKEVLKTASFESPFETGVTFLETSGMCEEVVRRTEEVGRSSQTEEVGRSSQTEEEFVRDTVRLCTNLQRGVVSLMGCLVACWVVFVVLEDRLKKYSLSDFMRDRKDFTDLLNSYDPSKEEAAHKSVLGGMRNDEDV